MFTKTPKLRVTETGGSTALESVSLGGHTTAQTAITEDANRGCGGEVLLKAVV